MVGDWYRTAHSKICLIFWLGSFPWLFSPTLPCPTDTVVYWVSASVAGFALVCQPVFTVPLGKELKPPMKLIILVNQSSEVE